MVSLNKNGVFLVNGKPAENFDMDKNQARKGTICHKIMQEHNTSLEDGVMKIKFDALVSHDITYVGIIQTARASGLQIQEPYS